MTKRNPEFGGFSACFAVRAETDRKGKATPPARTETAMCEPVDWIYSDFNPLRPRGRRHLLSGPICVQIQDFNPLRPRGRRLCAVDDWCGIAGISTHSARKDGDERILSFTDTAVIFQPTPPARTETAILHKKPTILHHISTIKSHHTPSNHRQPTLHTSKTVLIVQFFRCESPRKFMFASGSHQTI